MQLQGPYASLWAPRSPSCRFGPTWWNQSQSSVSRAAPCRALFRSTLRRYKPSRSIIPRAPFSVVRTLYSNLAIYYGNRRLAPVQRKLSTASSLQRTSSCTLPEKTQDFYELFESLLYLEIDSTWRAGVLMRLGPSVA